MYFLWLWICDFQTQSAGIKGVCTSWVSVVYGQWNFAASNLFEKLHSSKFQRWKGLKLRFFKYLSNVATSTPLQDLHSSKFQKLKGFKTRFFKFCCESHYIPESWTGVARELHVFDVTLVLLAYGWLVVKG